MNASLGPQGNVGTPGPAGHNGPIGPPGVGVPSPDTVTTVQVIQLHWEFIAGSEIREHLEWWLNGQRIGSQERGIGVTGADGPC